MASIEYQGIKFSGGKFFIILSLLGAIIGGGWSAYKFYDDYLDMKAQIQNFVSPDLSGFDKKIALVEQELEMIKTEISMILEEVSLVASTAKELKDDLKTDLRQMEGDIRHITEIVNDVEDRQKEDARELLDEIKILEDNLDLKINKALNNPLNNMSANVK
jgi:peptidoglycan hydrolase CwlO-like protein|tara:strand:- start:5 stop:487 length:483 start_codon:yes stop_codon:yes gene_type:complete